MMREEIPATRPKLLSRVHREAYFEGSYLLLESLLPGVTMPVNGLKNLEIRAAAPS
jgi:hypothetical protein